MPLHSWGGPLADCCAASHGPHLVVYPTTITPGELPRAKAAWQAHSAPVTALHASPYGMQLVSGAGDGSVHLCVLFAKHILKNGLSQCFCYMRCHVPICTNLMSFSSCAHMLQHETLLGGRCEQRSEPWCRWPMGEVPQRVGRGAGLAHSLTNTMKCVEDLF